MNVAIVHFVVDPGVGAGMAVKSVALARALTRAGVAVTLITTDVGLDRRPPPEMPGVDLVILPTRFRRFSMPRTSLSALRGLLTRCDAALLMNHWSMLNAMAGHAAHSGRVPYAFCPGGALAIQGRSTILKRIYQASIGRLLIRHAGAIVATTPLEATQFEALGVPMRKVLVIPNGVEANPGGLTADAFRASQRLGPEPVLLFMGRLNAIKGPDLLLEAFGNVASSFPGWRLVFAGADEGLKNALRARAEALGLTARITMTGLLTQDAATGAYRAASLLVVPSRHEAMSQVALEAAVAGTPVLLTDACGFEAVERVGGGQVVPATIDGLTAGLNSLLRKSPDELTAVGERLRAFVLDEYGWPVVVKKYVEMFRSIAP